MTLKTYPELPILMVDDEPAWLRTMAMVLKMSGGINHVTMCSDARDVLVLLLEKKFSLVILDLNMPHMDGESLLRMIKENQPEIPVVIISGMNQMDTAIRCVKAGAEDFFVKTDDRQRVVAGIRRVLENSRIQNEQRDIIASLMDSGSRISAEFPLFNTCSTLMYGVFSYLKGIARSREPLLINGESGTGKELIARSLHALHGVDTPWVAVNVAGLDDMVFSDTLFGHVKGAYTGAERDRPGMIQQAGSGILFLDEIGDLSSASQVKLLRLLEEGEYYPLGSDKPRRLSARIIAATNRDLKEEETEGRFRRDLLYRLSIHQVTIPPLRERPDDIPLLMDGFLDDICAQLGVSRPVIPIGVLKLLKTYPFPGNIRELRALIYDAVCNNDQQGLAEDFFRQKLNLGTTAGSGSEDQPLPASKGIVFPDPLPTLKEITQSLITVALERSQGNQSQAAKLLGISQQALHQRLKRQL